MFRLLIGFFMFSSAFGQIPVDSLFTIAGVEFEEGNVDSAFTIYKNITDHHKTEKIYSRALYNLAWTAMSLEKHDIAEKASLEILRSDFNDYEKGPGEGLMSEPYSLYKHRACKMLVDIYLKKQDYKSALKYEKLTDKKYPYAHFCGNELAANEIYKSLNYAKCYAGLGEVKKAINILLKKSFNSSFADNSEVIVLLDSLLSKEYSRNVIMAELQKAEVTMKIKKKQNDNIYLISIFNTDIEISDDIELFLWGRIVKMNLTLEALEKLTEWEKFLLYYKNTVFYKTLST